MEKLATYVIGAILAVIAVCVVVSWLFKAAFGFYGPGGLAMVWLPVAALAWFKRETLLRWWYSLTPHPATDLVNGAIEYGQELDGDRFAALVRAGGAGSPIEKRVRARQARELTERWQAHENALRAKEARLVEAAQTRAEAQNEVLEAQAELLNAAIAHEQAQARVETLRSRGALDER